MDVFQYAMFSNIKTNNTILDTLLSIVAIGCMSYIAKKVSSLFDNGSGITPLPMLDQIKSCFVRKNMLVIEGRRTTSTSTFNINTSISLLFSNRFKAIWHKLIQTVDTNPSISEIKEICNMLTTNRPRYDENDQVLVPTDELDLLVVSQKRPFLFNKDLNIYAVVQFVNDDIGDEDKKKNGSSSIKAEQIVITLYSYTTSVNVIKDYVNSITMAYLKAIELERKPKRFVYTLQTTKYVNRLQECWCETPFDTNRTFQNMFFDGKVAILEKIQFFLENKAWYDKMGIPYTLGIGLSGPPGTGKTSFIKALANLTDRHIIIISLQLIKTRKQLYEVWNECQYNTDNKKNGIPFSEKIIVIEDIDCAGDIILKRDYKRVKNDKNDKNANNVVTTTTKEDNNLVLIKPAEEQEPYGLDDILNIIDGIRETPGRILVISSNHYNKLDEALVRPGRIDITIAMEKASRATVKQMYEHFYGEEMPPSVFKKVKEKQFSPAEIIQLYVLCRNDSALFCSRIHP
uniref:AAA+ ATPase domain-containing protein n=1 Tax=viral metagenome TaxID=1070528 RepID=A0A6C0I2Q4_9ZZZZ